MASVNNRFRAALRVNKRVSFSTVLKLPDVAAIRCRWSGERVLVVMCYCAPSEDIGLVLEPLDPLLNAYPNDNVILVGDFNAKSTIWGINDL